MIAEVVPRLEPHTNGANRYEVYVDDEFLQVVRPIVRALGAFAGGLFPAAQRTPEPTETK